MCSPRKINGAMDPYNITKYTKNMTMAKYNHGV